MRSALVTLALFASTVMAAEIPGFVRWSSDEIEHRYRSMKSAAGRNFTVATMGEFGSDLLVLVHRDGTGEAEWHERHVDVFFVHRGEAVLVIGGTLVGAKDTGPGEKRAPRIEGGERVPLRPGDVVRIPARVPHQVVLENGAFDYAVMKIVNE